MRKNNHFKDSWKFVFGCISAVGALVSIAEYITDTGLMGNISFPPFVYLFLAVGCIAFLLYLVCSPIFSRIQAMRPVNRFKQLHFEIEREWQNIQNDDENYSLSTDRTLDDIYRDRVRLSRKLSKLRIYAPDPDDDENWPPFVFDLSLLSEEGLLGEAQRHFWDPRHFHEPLD